MCHAKLLGNQQEQLATLLSGLPLHTLLGGKSQQNQFNSQQSLQVNQRAMSLVGLQIGLVHHPHHAPKPQHRHRK